ncbi:MAG: hypothetical protein Q7J84_03930 [Sulfuricaulis sp.]|nr:hypothetical protein [Sulfuricaulis sp.]
MPALSTLTLAQLRSFTAVQIATALKNRIDGLTKRQLINLVLAIQDYQTETEATLSDAPSVTTNPDGQVASQVEVTRDVLGAKSGTRRTDWSYYAPLPGREQGCVDVIRVRTYDASDKVLTDVKTERHKNG